MVGVSFPLKEGQGALSAGCWGCLTLRRLQLHQKLMACVSLVLPDHALTSVFSSASWAGGWRLSALFSAEVHSVTCSPSLPLGASFLVTAGLQGDSGPGVPRTSLCTYKIQVQLVYSAYAVHEKLIQGVKRGAGLKKYCDGYPSWDWTAISGLSRKKVWHCCLAVVLHR